ncbi:hypothetical protein MHYP_G00204340 [Metynnis hypsauchen]
MRRTAHLLPTVTVPATVATVPCNSGQNVCRLFSSATRCSSSATRGKGQKSPDDILSLLRSQLTSTAAASSVFYADSLPPGVEWKMSERRKHKSVGATQCSRHSIYYPPLGIPVQNANSDEGDFPLFPSDVLEEVGGVSDRDPIPLVTANNIPPNLLREGDAAEEPSTFNTSFHTPLYLGREEAEASVPPDFELRESGISPGNLGVWSKRRLEVGEQFGPFEGTPSHGDPKHPHGWELPLRLPASWPLWFYIVLSVSLLWCRHGFREGIKNPQLPLSTTYPSDVVMLRRMRIPLLAQLKPKLINPAFNQVKYPCLDSHPLPSPLQSYSPLAPPSIRHQSVTALNRSQGHMTRSKVECRLGQGQPGLILLGRWGRLRGIRLIEGLFVELKERSLSRASQHSELISLWTIPTSKH